MQRATSRLHSGDSTATPLGRHYSAKKLCHSATFPEASDFLVRILHAIKQHTRRKHPRPTEPLAGRASKLLFCWKNLHDSDLLSDTTACGREMRGLCFTVFCVLKRHETPHKQRVVRLLEGSLHRVGKCDTFSLGPNPTDPPTYYAITSALNFTFFFLITPWQSPQ